MQKKLYKSQSGFKKHIFVIHENMQVSLFADVLQRWRRKAFSAYIPDILSSELYFTVTGSARILLPSGQHPDDDVN